jgi:hypothetical protein
MMPKVEGHIANAVQVGQDVIVHGKDGTTMFAVCGDLMEFAPGWVAVRLDTMVVVYDHQNLLMTTIPQDGWNKGLRPQIS